MLDHPIVDVALGLILLYSTLSLVASVVKEWISSVFALRAKNLQKGIQNLIGEAHATRLYGHPLISTLAKDKKLPSYIGSGTFASVLVDMLAQDEDGKSVVAASDKPAALVDRVGDDPVLGPAFRALSHAGAETVADLRREIAAWFDEGMNRVSGWYRRRTRLIIFVIGAAVAVSANASTVHVVRDLWEDDALRYALAQHRPWWPLPMRGVRTHFKCRMTFSRPFRLAGRAFRTGVWKAGSRICSGGCSPPWRYRSGHRSGLIC